MLDATRALLREVGFGGVSIEGVAARSGVAKTTIYRHWPDKNLLLLDGYAVGAPKPDFPCTDDLRADLLSAMRQLAHDLTSSEWAGLLPSMIEAAESDEEFLQISRPFIEARRQPMKLRLKAALRSGQLPEDTDIEMVMALLTGPLFYRRLLTHQPLTARLVEGVLDAVLAGVGPR